MDKHDSNILLKQKFSKNIQFYTEAVREEKKRWKRLIKTSKF
jgi:hypothetical protein